jgi:formate dehydrogenase iron-sulfur subunit
MGKVTMLVDTSKCTGCRGCQVACKEWNDLPATDTTNWGSYENPPDLSGSTWTRIAFREVASETGVKWLFLKEGCMHCTQAACVEVCPTAALQYSDMGFVSFNRDACNGCGYCAEFCPFQIPRLETNALTGQGKATKCTLCQDRVTNDMVPACAKTCPANAIHFGDRGEMVAMANRRMEELQASGHANATLYGEKELGGLGRMYVLLEKPAAYGLPEDPQIPALAGFWQKDVQPFGYAAVGLTLLGLGFNWLVQRRNNTLALQAEEEEEA